MCFRNVFGIENSKDHENFMNEAKKNILDRTSVWNARISITGMVRNERYLQIIFIFLNNPMNFW